MRKPVMLSLVAATCLFGRINLAHSPSVSPAPGPDKIEFVRDVQPIFRQNCVGCHGPSQQMNGFRLDRRRDALRGGTATVIGPGNSAGSRLYLRLIGNAFGTQMPPTGALPPSQVATIKAWIDQGAEWPDAASGEEAPPAPDPTAMHMAALLHDANLRAFKSAVALSPKSVNLRADGGSTPMMHAVHYADTATIRELLDRGADPNVANDAGATALMWAVSDIDKMRALIERGADVNVKSMDGRTALLIARTLTC